MKTLKIIPPRADIRYGVVDGKVELFFASNAEREDAKRLAKYLAETIKLGGYKLARRGEIVKVHMLVKKELQNDQNELNLLAFEGTRISRNVFDGAAVEVHSCNEHLKTLKFIPPRADIRYGVVEGKVEVFFATNAEREDAKRLAKYLAAGAITLESYKLARRGEIVEVHMLVKPGFLNNPGEIVGFRELRNNIAVNVFNGTSVEMHLYDDDFFSKVVQVLKDHP